MKSLLPALAVLVFSLPSSGVVLEQGDIVYPIWSALLRLDPETGTRDVISGCTDPIPNAIPFACGGPLVGNGPAWYSTTAALPQPDGSVIVLGWEWDAPGLPVAIRVDPTSGNRTVISREDDGGLPLSPQSGASVVPFFPPQMAALPSWGLPLAAGLFVGLALRRVRPRAAE